MYVKLLLKTSQVSVLLTKVNIHKYAVKSNIMYQEQVVFSTHAYKHSVVRIYLCIFLSVRPSVRNPQRNICQII